MTETAPAALIAAFMTTDHARQLIERLSNKRVLAIGDLMLDEFIYGRVSRISPEAPVPVVPYPVTSRELGRTVYGFSWVAEDNAARVLLTPRPDSRDNAHQEY